MGSFSLSFILFLILCAITIILGFPAPQNSNNPSKFTRLRYRATIPDGKVVVKPPAKLRAPIILVVQSPKNLKESKNSTLNHNSTSPSKRRRRRKPKKVKKQTTYGGYPDYNSNANGYGNGYKGNGNGNAEDEYKDEYDGTTEPPNDEIYLDLEPGNGDKPDRVRDLIDMVNSVAKAKSLIATSFFALLKAAIVFSYEILGDAYKIARTTATGTGNVARWALQNSLKVMSCLNPS